MECRLCLCHLKTSNKASIKYLRKLNSCIWFRSGSTINLGMIMINIKPTPHFGKLFFFLPMVASMDNSAIKTPNPKCRLYGYWIVFLDLLVFSTDFVNYCPPLTFSLVSSPPPPLPLPCVNKQTVYSYTVCRGGGEYGVIGGEGASDR